jgi:hypothetical protein
VAAQAIAELSTTGANAARTGCLLCRGLFLRVYARYLRAGAAELSSGARAACTAATGFAGVAALILVAASPSQKGFARAM